MACKARSQSSSTSFILLHIHCSFLLLICTGAFHTHWHIVVFPNMQGGVDAFCLGTSDSLYSLLGHASQDPHQSSPSWGLPGHHLTGPTAESPICTGGGGFLIGFDFAKGAGGFGLFHFFLLWVLGFAALLNMNLKPIVRFVNRKTKSFEKIFRVGIVSMNSIV